MGLLPSINRVWITVDNTLFLWDYATDAFHIYNALDQVIKFVFILVPKPGVFTDSITHLLVLVTLIETHLVGVSYKNQLLQPNANQAEELQLFNTKLSTVTDGRVYSCGTSINGRIFLGGQEGELTEFVYGKEQGFFTKSCYTLDLNPKGWSLPFMTPATHSKSI